ncbi:MAG TPA: amino acid adenylation domain-containing protein, partial [Pyrinomonadaceae bacterium]
MDIKNVETIYPATPAQAALLAGGAYPAHWVGAAGALACDVRGAFDDDALDAAWARVVGAHAALRSCFVWQRESQPLQLVLKQVKSPVGRHDLSDPDGQAARLRDALAEWGRADVDLTAAPLCRLHVARLDDGVRRLALTYHHAVCDDAGARLVLQDLLDAYDAAAAGREWSPRRSHAYGRYLEWLKTQDAAGAREYWRRAFEGFDTPTLLAPESPASASRPARHATRDLRLSAEATDAVLRAASQLQVDFETLLLGAWALLLGRYCDTTDVAFGVTVSGPPADLADAAALVAPWQRTLPVRVRAEHNAEVGPWLQGLQAQRDELRRYEHFPPAQLKELGDVPAELPLYDSRVVLDLDGVELRPAAGLNLGEVGQRAQVNFPLSLRAERGTQLTLGLTYDGARFDDAAAERLLGHLDALLAGVASAPERRISDLPLLAPDELERVLVGWNDTARAYPRESSVAQLFEAQAELTPDAPAVVAEDEVLTYAELNRRANRLAHYLRNLGVGAESLVGLALERSADAVVALLGVLKAGGAYVPLDLQNPFERINFMLQETHLPLLLTRESIADDLPVNLAHPVLLDADADLIAAESDANPEPLASADNLAYVMYTSGSTGRPKGIGVPHRGIVRLVKGNYFADLARARAWLQLAPLSFDASTLEVWGALLNGACLHLMPPGAPTLAELGAALRRQRIDLLWLTAGLFHQMVDSQLADLSGVGRVIAGGDVLSLPHVRKFLAAAEPGAGRLVNGYGPTENTTFSCCYPMAAGQTFDTSVPIGPPIANTQAYVLDSQLRPVPVGVTGELYLGGAGLARGYQNRPALTAERFVPHPHSPEPGARLYRTGDLARWLSDGSVEFLGRSDFQVKVRGYRIELGEVESALATLPGVQSVCAVAREQRLVAYVVVESADAGTGSSPSSGGGGASVVALPAAQVAGWREQMRRRLPDYMVPSVFVGLDALPLTPNGKVDRKALPQPTVEAAEAGASAGGTGWRTAEEELVAGVYAQVLGVGGVTPDSDFFSLGGHSLLATQLVSRVREVFGVELPLRVLFEHPTPRGLAAELTRLRRDAAGADDVEAGVPGPAAGAAEGLRSRGQGVPLSFAQQRLWFLDQLEPGASAYNVPLAVRLTGQLDAGALARSLSEIVSRHESLRTTFDVAADGQPVQVIADARVTEVPLEDLRGLPEAVREDEARRLARAEAERPFDLTRGPLLRARLLRLSDEEHVLLVTMHHIVSDGWSMGVLVREVAALYGAYAAGAVESPLAELPIQYADFAVWQREFLQGERLEAELAYWRGRLGGELPVLELPTDRPRPAMLTHRGARQTHTLPPALVAALRDLGREEGATLFMVLLAAFKVLLMRLGGQTDVIVGSPIANRNRAEVEPLVGFFVNTLALRTDLSGDPGFRDLLARVREVCLDAYAHQDVPFEKLVEELQPERDLTRSPLFQVMFVLQNASNVALELPGLSLNLLDGETETAKFDLMLTCVERGDALDGVLEYNTDLFDADTVARLWQHFGTLLDAAVDAPGERVGRLPLLDEAQRRQLLDGWNQTARAYPHDRCVHELFAAQAVRTPDAVAVSYLEERLTYAQLDARANRLARHLQAVGVGPDAIVGVNVGRGADVMVALLGVLKAGGAYLPLDPEYPAERIRFMLEDAGARVLLTQEILAPALQADGLNVVRLDTSAAESEQYDATCPASAVTPENLAYVIYTSGSTGRPKGAMVRHAAVLNLAAGLEATAYAALAATGGAQTDAALNVSLNASLSFDASVQQWVQLLAGHRLDILPEGVRRDGAALARHLRERAVDVFDCTPSQLRLLLAAGLGGDAPYPRLVLVGGEAIERGLWAELRAQPGRVYYNVYGPTECTVDAVAAHVRGEREIIGRPLANVRAYVLDQHLAPAPVGVAGELYLGGAGLARGYLNRPALTAEKFVPDPFSSEPGARLYRTGDVARWLPDGELEFIGRVDHQVKVRGYRIELGEVESALSALPGIRSVCAVAREQRLVAYVVAESADADAGTGSSPSSVVALPATQVSAWRERMKRSLPDYMVPSVFVGLGSLPMTPNGKVDRKALPAPEAAESAEVGEAGGGWRTAEEELVAGVYAQVLGVGGVTPDSDFFSLGGHSLLATQAAARLRSVLGVEVPLRLLFERPAVRELAEALRAARPSAAEVASPDAAGPVAGAAEGLRTRGQGVPLSFAQQRLWFLDQLEPGASAYNLPAAVRLRGALDVGALERTLREVVRRHESLRTRFAARGGVPEQVAGEAADVRLEVSEARGEAEAEAVLRREAGRPFDLGRGPLLRAALVRLTGEEHVLLLTMHHIVSDGWSMGVLVREVTALYAAYASGAEESPLGELPIQYADFAVWQREFLRGERLKAELAYWHAQLQG